MGEVNIVRDWGRGWEPEYVEVMWIILQHHDKADDFIIASGEANSLGKLVYYFALLTYS